MFLFVTYRGARAARGRAAGTRQRRGTQASGHLPGPATRLWGQDYGRRSGSRVRRCHRAGWDGRKWGEGRRGVGEAKGVARRAPLPGSAEVRRVQRVARSPEAPELQLLLPELPRARRAGTRSHPPPASSRQDPAGTHPPPPAPPGGSAPGAPTRTSCRPPARPAAVIVRPAPPTSTAPAAPAPTLGLRAQQLRAPGCRGRGGSGLRVQRGRSAINTRGRRRRGSASGAGGGRPRSKPSKVARGGGEGGAGGVGGERAQGRHGRLDAGPRATRAGRSGAKRAAAASPPRAPAERPQPCARAGPAASEAGEREVKAIAPLPGPGPAPSAGGAGAPRRPSRGDGERATAPSSVRAGNPRASAPRPAPLRPGDRCAAGAASRERRQPGAPLPDPTSPPRICALLGPKARTRVSARRHGTELRKRWGVRCATRDTPIVLLWLKAI